MDEIDDLVLYLLELDEGRFEGSSLEEIHNLFYEKFGITVENFSKLTEVLVPLCTNEESLLSGITYQGFSSEYRWLLKKEVK